MQKLTQVKRKEYPPSILYLEQLEEIEELAKQEECEFELRTKDHRFSNVAEFKSKHDGQLIKHLDLSLRNPSISIRIRHLSLDLYSHESGTKSIGIFYQLDSIIDSASRKPTFFYKNYLYLSFAVLGVNIIALKTTNNLISIPLLTITTPISILLSYCSLIALLEGNQTIVKYKRQQEAKSVYHYMLKTLKFIVLLVSLVASLVEIISYFKPPSTDTANTTEQKVELKSK